MPSHGCDGERMFTLLLIIRNVIIFKNELPVAVLCLQQNSMPAGAAVIRICHSINIASGYSGAFM